MKGRFLPYLIIFGLVSLVGLRPAVQAQADKRQRPIYIASRLTNESLVTLTANVPTAGGAVSAPVWFFGAPGDHTGASQTAGDQLVGYTIDLPLSVTTTCSDFAAGLLCSTNANEPVMFHDANGTAAGTLEYLNGAYTVN